MNGVISFRLERPQFRANLQVRLQKKSMEYTLLTDFLQANIFNTRPQLSIYIDRYCILMYKLIETRAWTQLWDIELLFPKLHIQNFKIFQIFNPSDTCLEATSSTDVSNKEIITIINNCVNSSF